MQPNTNFNTKHKILNIFDQKFTAIKRLKKPILHQTEYAQVQNKYITHQLD